MKKELVISIKYKSQIEKELKDLQENKRTETIKVLQKARALGDLSENAEYQYAKKTQGEIEGRIRVIQSILEFAKVIDPTKENKDVIGMGSVVTLKEKKSKEKIIYEIVSTEEVDLFSGKISDVSPIGKLIVGHRVGDFIEFNEKTFEIILIE